MGKFLKSLTDGTLRCRYCGDSVCNCMEDGQTKVEIVSVDKETEKARLVHFRRQTLSNGKKIPTGVTTWIPNKAIYEVDAVLKFIVMDNDFINKMAFDVL